MRHLLQLLFVGGVLGNHLPSTYTSFATACVAAPQITLPLAAPADYVFGERVADAVAEFNGFQTECIVTPLGWNRDDSGQIMAAIKKCGNYGIITLPAPYVYTISRRLYSRLKHSQLNILGTLVFSADLGYWIDNSHRVEFQNQSTAWIIEAHDSVITGGGWNQGGLDGQGQAWYGRAKGLSNQFGRPIAISLYKSHNVTIRDLTFRHPQFWASWVQDSQDITLTGIYINGTNTDPYGNSSNWMVNVDGIDSMRVNGLAFKNSVFHGGDDCAAPKGNSTNLLFRNLTCIGGGIAFGSIGQYKASPDYITNVTATDITVSQRIDPRLGGSNVSGGAYFKSWVGFEAGKPPQGGGGGTGAVSNITFTNLTVHNVSQAVYVNKCYHKVAEQAAYCDTSTLRFGDMAFHGVAGMYHSQFGISLNCSAAAPCQHVLFDNVNLQREQSQTQFQVYCANVEGLQGLKCSNVVR